MRRYTSLRGRREFALVLRRGRSSSNTYLSMFALVPNNAQPPPRVGIVITKKVGTAVERNRLRRRCKAILDRSNLGDAPMWYVIQFRPSASALTFAQLDQLLASALASSSRAAGNQRTAREAVGR